MGLPKVALTLEPGRAYAAAFKLNGLEMALGGPTRVKQGLEGAGFKEVQSTKVRPTDAPDAIKDAPGANVWAKGVWNGDRTPDIEASTIDPHIVAVAPLAARPPPPTTTNKTPPPMDFVLPTNMEPEVIAALSDKKELIQGMVKLKKGDRWAALISAPNVLPDLNPPGTPPPFEAFFTDMRFYTADNYEENKTIAEELDVCDQYLTESTVATDWFVGTYDGGPSEAFVLPPNWIRAVNRSDGKVIWTQSTDPRVEAKENKRTYCQVIGPVGAPPPKDDGTGAQWEKVEPNPKKGLALLGIAGVALAIGYGLTKMEEK